VGVFRRDASDEVEATPNKASSPAIRASKPAQNQVLSGPAGIFLNQSATSVSYNSPRTLTAAAAQVKVNDRAEYEQFRSRRAAGSSAWQTEAWEYYDAIGEIKYAFNLVASVVSRIRIFAASVDDPSQTAVPVKMSNIIDPRLAAAAERALKRLDSAYGGQAGLLKDAALNICVAGECYLVQMPERPGYGIPESWDIKSVDEVLVDQKGTFRIIGRREQQAANGSQNANTNVGAMSLNEKSFVGRIWRSHPRFSDEADSSLRGILDLCAELLLLNRTFRATARSRLNAGALYLPDGLSVAAQGDGNFPYDEDDEMNPGFTVEEAEDEFEDQLIDAMTTPIRDEESASAVVPLIIRGPAELGDKIKQFKFERSFDPALAQRADRVLERIMQGIDVPKDVVTGLANVKYSNAVQIDEALYKAHIEPLVLLIVDALTVVYLRPYLLATGYTPAEVERIVVWYDPSAVATRNDRATDADAGLDRGAVSLETWRRAHGFSAADAPTPNEMAIRMLQEKGTITPELTEAMLGALAPEVLQAIRSSQQQTSVAPIPPEVQQILDQAKGAPAQAEAAPEAEEEATPTPERPDEVVVAEPTEETGQQ
jgi:hypothetical protein